ARSGAPRPPDRGRRSLVRPTRPARHPPRTPRARHVDVRLRNSRVHPAVGRPPRHPALGTVVVPRARRGAATRRPRHGSRTHRLLARSAGDSSVMTVELDFTKLTRAASEAADLASAIRSNAASARSASPIALPSLNDIEKKAT